MSKMTFEKFDSYVMDLFYDVKMNFIDWGKVIYKGAKGIPEGRLDDLIKALGRIIEMLTDVRTELFQMASYERGYEKGIEESKGNGEIGLEEST